MTLSEKKTLLISGGSRGIGRASVLAAAMRGWNVAFTYRSDAKAAQDTARAAEAVGGRVTALQGDTVSESDVIRNFDDAVDKFGRIDGVVVNAGIVAPSLPIAEMSLERMERVIQTNVVGALLFAREAARRLPRSQDEEGASITFVSSVAARLGSPFEYVDYAASKGAVDTMTLGLAKELAPQNIRVNAVRPGLIETDIHASGGEPDRAWRLGKTVPMARPGKAEEIAEAIIWLSSDAASYTTGALLDVTGGR